MPYPRIAAVATATPTQRFTQAELLGLAGYADERRRGFFEASDIAGRHLYIDREHFRPDESVDELNDRFRRGALELGERAARAVLDRAGWAADEVDFLATTTCTGRLTPSLDAHLVARLGCRPGVQRVHVGDTGCAAAMVALQQACNHLQAFPDHHALVMARCVSVGAFALRGAPPLAPGVVEHIVSQRRREVRGQRSRHRSGVLHQRHRCIVEALEDDLVPQRGLHTESACLAQEQGTETGEELLERGRFFAAHAAHQVLAPLARRVGAHIGR